MPRRLVATSPLERKPMYLDAESPAPARRSGRRRACGRHEAAFVRRQIDGGMCAV